MSDGKPETQAPLPYSQKLADAFGGSKSVPAASSAKADAAASEIGARAYTGEKMVFADKTASKHLTAHEAAHVVQSSCKACE